MTTNTKNILTDEEIKKELQHMAKAEIYQAAVVLAIVCLLFLLFLCVGISVARSLLLVGLAVILLFAGFFVLALYRLIARIHTARRIARGGFSVVTDTLCRMAQEPTRRHGGFSTVFYFSAHGKAIPSHGVTPLAAIGDAFYLVVLDDKKKSVRLTYAASMYDYKGMK